jgi:hypothetical protein
MANRTLPLLTVAATFVVAATAFGQQPKDDDGWMKAQWKAESTYAKARREIDALAGEPVRLEAIIKDAFGKCTAKKPSQLDLYRWAYASCRRARNDYDYWYGLSHSSTRKAPSELFQAIADNDSYEFARARFLYTVAYDFPHQKLIPLGERLLKSDPDDQPVMLALVRLYQPQVSNDQRAKGEDLVKKLDKVDGRSLSTLATTSYFYYLAWRGSQSKADAQQARDRGSLVIQTSRSSMQKKLIKEKLAELGS